MAGFVKGDVVIVPFPFSDLAHAKRRPALVLSVLQGDDIILCQITSRQVTDSYAIPLSISEFQTGSLKQESNVRPNRIFTADRRIVLYRAGQVFPEKIQEVVQRVIEILER